MYGVSNDYITAMHQRVQRHKIKGTIGNVAFNDENILEGSLTIVNQCSGNEEVGIGQVFVGELTATFLNVNIERGYWQDKEITVIFSQNTEGTTWEDIPVGVYTVAQADWSASGVIVKAYDHMQKFDDDCGIRFTATTPYDMLTYACTECGVEFGMTQAQVEALTNGNTIYDQYPESDIETWRDLISWLAQTLVCNATMSRTGALLLKPYTDTAVDTIDAYHRHDGCTFSDFATRYTGISVVNMSDNTTSYYSQEVDDGLTYNLGSNPFLQNRETERRALLDALAIINYVPFTSTMIGNPAYDLGDVLTFTGGSAGTESMCCITKYVYKHHGGYYVTGVGKNPKTANGKSKTDKNIAGIISRGGNGDVLQDVVTNGRYIGVPDGYERRIMRAMLVTKDNAKIKADIEILLEITAPDEAILEVTYYVDGIALTRQPVETYTAGKHVLALMVFMPFALGGNHTFDIYFTINGGSVDVQKFDAMIIFTGSGLVADTGFNGELILEDFQLEPTNIVEMVMQNDASDSVTVAVQAPLAIGGTDVAPRFTIPEIEDARDANGDIIWGEVVGNMTWQRVNTNTWGALNDNYLWGGTL